MVAAAWEAPSLEVFAKMLVDRRDEWGEDAACRGSLVGAFYPPTESDEVRIMTGVCSGCRVRRDCVTLATVTKEQGVWGSTTRDRQRIWRAARDDSQVRTVASVLRQIDAYLNGTFWVRRARMAEPREEPDG